MCPYCLHAPCRRESRVIRQVAEDRLVKTGWSVPITGLALVALLLLLSCASLRQAPDPARVLAQIEEYRAQEIELVRTTVADPERVGRFVELLAERDRLAARYAKQITEHREKLAVIAAVYDTGREDFQALRAGG